MRKVTALLAVAALGLLVWLLLPADRTRRVYAPAPPRSEAGAAAAPETSAPVMAAAPESPGGGRVSGTVRTEEGRPIAGAKVRGVFPDGPAATTGSDGTYEIPALPFGSYPLRAAADGYAAVERQTIVVTPEVHLDFALPLSAPILGNVVDQHGLPIEGARLQAARAAAAGVLRLRETDADGAFRFDEAYAGEWWLSVMPPDETVFEAGRDLLVAGGGRPIRLVLQRREGTRRLVLEVVGPDGALLPISQGSLWADVVLAYYPAQLEIAPGEVVAPHVGPGRWRLELKTRIGGVSRIIDVPPGEGDVRQRLEVGAPGCVTGRADATGLAALPAQLYLMTSHQEGRWTPPPRHAGKSRMGFALLDAEDGYAFRLDDVRSGIPVDLYAKGDECYGHARVELEAGGEARAVIRLRPAGTLSVTVRNHPPVRRLFFEFIPDGEENSPPPGPTILGHSIDSVKVFLPAGGVRWRARWFDPEDGLPVLREGEATVEASATTNIEVDLR